MNTAIDDLAQGKPYKPKSGAENFEADKLAVLEELRRAGSRGVTTLEFIQRGIGGMRPPNRVCDCRKDDNIIQTIREGGGTISFHSVARKSQSHAKAGKAQAHRAGISFR